MPSKSYEAIELKSIISGLFYLCEESYRSGYGEIGRILRDSLLGIQRHLTVTDDKNEQEFSATDLLQLFELLDVLRNIPAAKKRKLLNTLSDGSLKDIH